jgi:hypothetical protein
MATKDKHAQDYVANEPILHNGITYNVGETLTLFDYQAAELLSIGAIIPTTQPQPTQELQK